MTAAAVVAAVVAAVIVIAAVAAVVIITSSSSPSSSALSLPLPLLSLVCRRPQSSTLNSSLSAPTAEAATVAVPTTRVYSNDGSTNTRSSSIH